MSELDILNSRSVKKFVKNTFVLFGLFAVLSYAFATVVLLSNNGDSHRSEIKYIRDDSTSKSHRDSSAYSHTNKKNACHRDSSRYNSSDTNSKFHLEISGYGSPDSSRNFKNNVFTWASVVFIGVVHLLAILGFLFVVKPKYKTLREFICIKKDEDALRKTIKADIFGKVCLLVAEVMESNGEKDAKILQELLIKIHEECT